MVKFQKNNKGFSLIELMIAMLLSSVVLAGIYSAYRSQLESYVTQERVVDMQQNIRTAVYYLKRSLQMAGYDPSGSANAKFVSNFDFGFHSIHVGKIGATDANNVAFTIDEDEDGRIDNCTSIEAGCAVIDDNVDNEMIAYRLNNNSLQMYRGSTASWVTLADNIDALDIVYLGDIDGLSPFDPLPAPLNLSDILSVQVTIIARTTDNNLSKTNVDNSIYRNQQGAVIYGPAGDNHRRNYLTTQVRCRNLGL